MPVFGVLGYQVIYTLIFLERCRKYVNNQLLIPGSRLNHVVKINS